MMRALRRKYGTSRRRRPPAAALAPPAALGDGPPELGPLGRLARRRDRAADAATRRRLSSTDGETGSGRAATSPPWRTRRPHRGLRHVCGRRDPERPKAAVASSVRPVARALSDASACRACG